MASLLGLILQVMSRWHTTLVAAALLTLTHPLDASGPAAQNVFAEPPTVGGVQVYLKLDFEASDGGFQAEGNAVVTVEAEPVSTAHGRSLHVRRARPGEYIGAHTDQLRVKGVRGLKIAFLLRGTGMDTVSLNLFDEVRRDNTTPASPAKLVDNQWRPVVFAVEDFHYNADPPERKVPADTQHTSLLFHGRERPGSVEEFWIDKLLVYRGDDTQPPAAPTDVSATVREEGIVELSWKEPPDNTFAAIYSIHRRAAGAAWVKIAESFTPQYQDPVSAAGEYTYRVTAADFDYNVRSRQATSPLRQARDPGDDRPRMSASRTGRSTARTSAGFTRAVGIGSAMTFFFSRAIASRAPRSTRKPSPHGSGGALPSAKVSRESRPTTGEPGSRSTWRTLVPSLPS